MIRIWLYINRNFECKSYDTAATQEFSHNLNLHQAQCSNHHHLNYRIDIISLDAVI